ncbi:hypothetical protein P3X46_007629 [Hevea brasiliensis]|uniref:Beta-galactosidase n=1 Tax=Hevea brasiliensis TaxID=3981 RepID=A0ABQ9MWL7_HEVBR|nr:hypothetical protein P3X46_007629 [Hevea brasiliensis]
MSNSKGSLFLLSILLFSSWIFSVMATVTYDHKAIVINGQRRILISGSIHYPRSTPEMWPGLIQKAKDGGLDMIQTYVFWNGHEPTQGQYYFEGRYDLVKFIKLVQQAGLYVHLRIGPYVCAEWNFGGFPMWLKYIPGIEFRTDNGPFKTEMQKFTTKIVDLMKTEKLFEPQGGPIILSQIENEYGPVEWEIGAPGKAYTKWAAEMAVGLNTGVPWIMCKQEDAPDPTIDTCNGFYCEGYKPNNYNKPKMWTENWTGWYTEFGGSVPYRPAEDTAFSVARFIANSGSFVNYYMYHGGTNFGRTAGLFMASSYDYDAPLDEYANYDTQYSVKVIFWNKEYWLPPWSISILPDCKTVVHNTARIGAQGTQMWMMPAINGFSWQSHNDEVTVSDSAGTFTHDGLWEQKFITSDKTDYLWYMIDVNIDANEGFLKNGQNPLLSVDSAGHVLHVFINGQLAGSVWGTLETPKVTFSQNVKLNAGINKISLLSATVGLANVGTRYDTWNAGVLGPVTLKGLNQGLLDLSKWKWSYKIGMRGEDLGLFGSTVTSPVNWVQGPQMAKKQPLTWYKTTFDAPPGNDPLALEMTSMGKGQVWINGQSIGRHWPAYKARGSCSDCNYAGTYTDQKCRSKCGEASQNWYHVPRSWLNPKGNLLVVFEEVGGDPTGISLAKRVVESVCADIYDDQPEMLNWKEMVPVKPKAHLWCPTGQTMTNITFASYGGPLGRCGSYQQGKCHSQKSWDPFQANCIGKPSCDIVVAPETFGGDPCPGSTKKLSVQVVCS